MVTVRSSRGIGGSGGGFWRTKRRVPGAGGNRMALLSARSRPDRTITAGHTRFPAGHGDVPDRRQLPRSTAQPPGPQAPRSAPATVRSAAGGHPYLPRVPAREVEPAVPATHRSGHKPVVSEALDAIHRSFQASARNPMTGATWTGCGRSIPRGYTARQPSATARSVPAVSTRTEPGRAGSGRYGDSVPAELRRSRRFDGSVGAQQQFLRKHDWITTRVLALRRIATWDQPCAGRNSTATERNCSPCSVPGPRSPG